MLVNHMTTTHNPGTCIAFRTPRPEQLQRVVTGPTLFIQLEEPCEASGHDISAEDYREISILDEFLTNHVQPNRIYNVQCMMLWTEWVRTFRRQTHKFPKRILEKECRSIITSKFGVGIANDSVRGAIYPGLRFVA
jgi:hypothetical protein